ncbi:MAG: HAD-IIB family hydrolase [Euryarchaeota archaeon]|nr:HAD-IIB family hydrolase [Euryarchaeota archaeon]
MTPEPPFFDDRPIRAVATDIDGTLTDMTRRLDWEAVRALRALEARGIPVILATGNVIPSTKTLAISIGTTGPVVCENGGSIYWELRSGDGATKQGPKVLKSVLYSRESADRVVEALRDRGHDPQLITSDPWRESEAALELSMDPEVVEETIRDLGIEDLYVVATGFAVHILDKGMDKAVGIRHAIDWLNDHDPRFAPKAPDATKDARPLALDEVLAIGDSRNDLEMVTECGTGGAVGNAPDELKRAADIVAKKDHGAGVREIVEAIGVRVE